MSAIRRDHDAGRVTRTRRRRLTVAAAAGTVTAIVASAIVGGLAASAAAGSPPGYRLLDGWQVGASSVDFHFLGTFEGVGAVATVAPLDANGYPVDRGGSTNARIGATAEANNPACLDGLSAVGSFRECGSIPYRLTFSQPVINPVIVTDPVRGHILRSLGVDGTADGDGCDTVMMQPAFTAVNGQAPRSGQIVVKDLGQGASYDPVTHRLSQSSSFPIDASICRSIDSYHDTTFQVMGVVSSIDFTSTIARAIIDNPNGRIDWPWDGGVGDGAPIRVELPSTDLSVVKTGPAIVGPVGTVDWSIAVANAAGSSASHGFIVKDAVPAEVTDPVIVTPDSHCSLVGHDLTCSWQPAGWSVGDASHPLVSQLSGGDPNAEVPDAFQAGSTFSIQLAGTAPLALGTVLANRATVAAVDNDPTPANNLSIVSTTVTAPVDADANVNAAASAAANGIAQAAAQGAADSNANDAASAAATVNAQAAAQSAALTDASTTASADVTSAANASAASAAQAAAQADNSSDTQATGSAAATANADSASAAAAIATASTDASVTGNADSASAADANVNAAASAGADANGNPAAQAAANADASTQASAAADASSAAAAQSAALTAASTTASADVTTAANASAAAAAQAAALADNSSDTQATGSAAATANADSASAAAAIATASTNASTTANANAAATADANVNAAADANVNAAASAGADANGNPAARRRRTRMRPPRPVRLPMRAVRRRLSRRR